MADYLFLIPISISLLLGAIIPGPSFIVISQIAISKSRSCGLAASMGSGLGAMIFAILASISLYVVIESVPLVYLFLKVAGGLYLCFLGYRLWASSGEDIQNNGLSSSNSVHRSFFLGLLTQLGNPKTAIVFASVFAAFLPMDPPTSSYIMLCAIAFTIDAAWYSLVSIVLSTDGAQKVYAQYKSRICKACGSLMGLIGIKLMTT